MYNKIFTKMLDSSIWLEDSDTRIVWITLLAAMDEDGVCQFASVVNLARRAIVSIEACKTALEKMEGPDEFSSDPVNNGRRIERIPGGWIVLNARKYRDLVTRSEIQRNSRDRVRRFRERKKGEEDPEATQGYIYYARSQDAVKIGFSRNPWARLKELRVSNPTVELIATERGTFIIEKQRHTQFSSFRKEGEWFQFSPEIEEFVATLVVDPNPTTPATGNACDPQSEAEAEAEAEIEQLRLTPDGDSPSVRPPVTTLELTGGKFHPITQADIELWQIAYPGIDVLQQLRKITVWLDANPDKRSATVNGSKQRIVKWLTRTQNDGGQYARTPARSTRNESARQSAEQRIRTAAARHQ